MISKRHVILGWCLIPFGAFLVLGGFGEVVGGVVPRLAGDGGTILNVLHANPVVRAWVVIQGLISIPLGFEFVRAGRALAVSNPGAFLRANRAAKIMLLLVVVSQLLLSVFLYPELLGMPEHALSPSPMYWIATLAGAAAGPLAL